MEYSLSRCVVSPRINWPMNADLGLVAHAGMQRGELEARSSKQETQNPVKRERPGSTSGRMLLTFPFQHSNLQTKACPAHFKNSRRFRVAPHAQNAVFRQRFAARWLPASSPDNPYKIFFVMQQCLRPATGSRKVSGAVREMLGLKQEKAAFTVMLARRQLVVANVAAKSRRNACRGVFTPARSVILKSRPSGPGTNCAMRPSPQCALSRLRASFSNAM